MEQKKAFNYKSCKYFLSDFGFKNYEVNLSTRPAKSVGTDQVWNLATAALIEALDAKGWDYVTDEGGGAIDRAED